MPYRLNSLSRISLQGSMALLVMFCVLPPVLAGLYVSFRNYELNRHVVEAKATLVARKAATDIDLELSSLIGGLKVLATSKALNEGNFADFYRQAQASVQTGLHYNIVLSDASGIQTLNTVRPYGEALPHSGNPPEMLDLIVNPRVVLTDVFTGPVTKKPTLAVAMPAQVGGHAMFSLGAGISPQKISALLVRQDLPTGWLIAVLDSKGTIAARSRDAELYVGQSATPDLRAQIKGRKEGTLFAKSKDGVPMVTAFTPLGQWGWTVVVGVPQVEVDGELLNNAGWFAACALAAMALGLFCAGWIGSRVMATVRQLNSAAKQALEGQDIQIPQLLLKEADAVASAILVLGQEMSKTKHSAHHDALTGLANRALLMELAAKQCANAARHGTMFALVAFDLDGFKLVNDTYGHDQGDAVLKEVAARSLRVVREEDTVARTGGDEFVVLLASMQLADVHHTVDRLIRELSLPYPGIGLPVSASAGVAVYGDDGTATASLMCRADERLYQAKKAGKKQFVSSAFGGLTPESSP